MPEALVRGCSSTVMAAPRSDRLEEGLSGWLGSRALSGRRWSTKNLTSLGDERLLPTTRDATPLSDTSLARALMRVMVECHSLYSDTGERFSETSPHACHVGNGCGSRIGYLPRVYHAGSPFSSLVHSAARTPTGFHRCLSLWGDASCDVLVQIHADNYGVPSHSDPTKLGEVWGRPIRTVKRCARRWVPVDRAHSPRRVRARLDRHGKRRSSRKGHITELTPACEGKSYTRGTPGRAFGRRAPPDACIASIGSNGAATHGR